MNCEPLRIEFGVGAIDRLDSVLASENLNRALFVCDGIFVKNGLSDALTARNPRIKAVFCEVKANPLLSDAKRAAELANRIDADCIVAMGGGSAIDLAKFAASYSQTTYEAEDYFYTAREFGKSIPVIAVPTTAGTGSEATAVAVMTNDKTGEKRPIVSESFSARVALIDPSLTLSVPPRITAATGFDAMSHALEAFWCRAHDPESDAYAKDALKLIFTSFEKAFFDGADLAARTDMCRGSLNAGLAFAKTRTAGVHACSYPLSEKCGLSHGEACAYTLDGFTRLNADAYPERMNLLAKWLGFSSSSAMADEIVRLKAVMGMRDTPQSIGIENADNAAHLAKLCLSHPLMNNNPVMPTAVRIENILMKRKTDEH